MEKKERTEFQIRVWHGADLTRLQELRRGGREKVRKSEMNCGKSFAAPWAYVRSESSAFEDLGMQAHSGVRADTECKITEWGHQCSITL